MLLLLFKIDDRHFAMDTSKIREIVPMVELHHLPNGSGLAVGWMRYRGKSIPVIDLCMLTADRPCYQKLSTRIIIVDYVAGDRREVLLGLIAEHVVETIRSKLPVAPGSTINLADLVDQPATRVMSEEMIQWFDPEQMLPAREVNNILTMNPDISGT
jgi:chemotaxis-related protein WspB